MVERKHPSVFGKQKSTHKTFQWSIRTIRGLNAKRDLVRIPRSPYSEMKMLGRHVLLVTNNCPSYPSVIEPPKSYTGPSPPVLTHVKLVYLLKNTTPYLQLLDQGIIHSFKASYRRRYADYLVSYLNTHSSTPPEIDILQVIHLIANSWSDVAPKVIYNCWLFIPNL